MVAVVGCGGDSPPDAAADGDADAGPAATELSSYPTIVDVNDALAGDGLGCDLEYEGLADADREISQCVLAGEPAVLTIWFDPAIVDEIVAGGAPGLAYGANWTVEVTSAANARAVAEALDGAVT